MTLKHILLSGAALAVLATPAWAADDNAAILKRLDAMERTISAQEKQIEADRAEINTLKQQLSKPATAPAMAQAPAPTATPAAPPSDVIAKQQAQIDTLTKKVDDQQAQATFDKQSQPVWSLASGRPLVTSADGRFTFAVRALGQFDTGEYKQSGNPNLGILPAANGPELSDGSNFRRAYLGLQGKVFGDWAYYFNYDFGSSKGNEQQGRIQSLYTEYDGIAGWGFRIGAYAPPANLEDQTSPADTIFLERNSPSDVARNIAAGDGRDAVSILYTGDRIFGSASLTGGKVADTNIYFGEQQALVGRLSGLVYTDANTNVLLSASGTDVFHGPENTSVPATSTRNITLSDPPELTFDDNAINLVSAGALNVSKLTEWGLEGAAQWTSFYLQGGDFGYDVSRRQSKLANPNFSGYYVQGTWILTGESRSFVPGTASFTSPKPRENFSIGGGGLGAWEIAARYSDMDLNYDAGFLGKAPPADAIRGGEQNITTIGLNWYPNANMKFMANYEMIDINRIGNIPAVTGVGGHKAFNNTDVGQTIDAFAVRMQIAW